MRPVRSLLTLGLALACVTSAAAQATLVAADFDACALPAGWEVDIVGNPDAVWYVGTPRNVNSDSASIDGTCMVVVDDDATGDGTPAFTWHLLSPSFDATGYTTLTLSADVHFRNAGEGASFAIEVSAPGGGWRELRRFRGADFTGERFRDAGRVALDLSLVADGPTRVRFSYDDNAGFAWWAGVDNVVVAGERGGSILLGETFDACALPAGWSAQTVRGVDAWQVGVAANPNLGAAAQSINGTCMAFFDDDVIGEDAPPSTVTLSSPWLDLRDVSELTLSLDYVFRRAVIDETFGVYLDDGVERQLVDVFSTDRGGPGFDESLRLVADLSALRRARARLVFEYVDGGGWGWYAGIDNVKLVGRGGINDRCARAVDLAPEGDPVAFDNRLALDGGTDCDARVAGSLWYRFTPPTSGSYAVEVASDFNDQLALYTGACDALTSLRCRQRDEHGFGGEAFTLGLRGGESYLLQVSGTRAPFGAPRGRGVVAFRQNPPDAPVAHATCAEALALSEGAWSTRLSNRGAPQPGVDTARVLRRHTQYARFTPSTTGDYLVTLDADFAAELRAYAGTACAPTDEWAAGAGPDLLLAGLPADEPVTVEVAGVFATVEAAWRLRVDAVDPAEAQACDGATDLAAGAWTGVPDLRGAGTPLARGSCARAGDRATWYRFRTDATGLVRLRGELPMPARAAVFAADCAAVQELACVDLPGACDVPAPLQLAADTEYALELSSADPRGAGRLRLDFGEPTAAPLTLAGMVVCGAGGLGELQLAASGGSAPYTYLNATPGETWMAGETREVIVRDDAGCEAAATLRSSCAVKDCGTGLAAAVADERCVDQADGRIELTFANDPDPDAVAWSDGAAGPLREGLGPGIYAAVVTGADGCQAERGWVIRAASRLAAEADVADAADGRGGSIDLRPRGGAGRYVYTWRDAIGNELSAREDLVGVPPGLYTVDLADANGCTATFGPYEIRAVSDLAGGTAQTMRLAPNPTDGWVRLSGVQAAAPGLPSAVTLVNALGRVIAVPLAREPTALRLDLSVLPAGTYFVRVDAGDGPPSVWPVVKVDR